MEWNGKPYHSLDYELRQQFGQKIYKLSLDGGMSCPNRDGTLGERGCIFCSQGGSGDFASWAAYVVGYDACLFEFPDVSSTQDFQNKGYGEDYINAICWLLQNYN